MVSEKFCIELWSKSQEIRVFVAARRYGFSYQLVLFSSLPGMIFLLTIRAFRFVSSTTETMIAISRRKPMGVRDTSYWLDPPLRFVILFIFYANPMHVKVYRVRSQHLSTRDANTFGPYFSTLRKTSRSVSRKCRKHITWETSSERWTNFNVASNFGRRCTIRSRL